MNPYTMSAAEAYMKNELEKRKDEEVIRTQTYKGINESFLTYELLESGKSVSHPDGMIISPTPKP